EARRLEGPAQRRGRPADGAEEADRPDPRRAGLDRPQVPGEGTVAALRDRQRAGDGPAAPPGERAGRRRPTVGDLSPPDVRPPAPPPPPPGPGVRAWRHPPWPPRWSPAGGGPGGYGRGRSARGRPARPERRLPPPPPPAPPASGPPRPGSSPRTPTGCNGRPTP